jgi:hypothetical protein
MIPSVSASVVDVLHVDLSADSYLLSVRLDFGPETGALVLRSVRTSVEPSGFVACWIRSVRLPLAWWEAVRAESVKATREYVASLP